MELGAFSISLAVKDIKASKAFYEKLGFKVLRRRYFAELADPEERRARDRSFSRDVREEYVNLQPWLGQ
jgi:catechol 2,3-dioxygenase-like lactoylglutathione lyase family enzyme